MFAPSSPLSGGGGNGNGGADPAPNYGSVADLLEQLQMGVDPAHLFDPHRELPPWLVQADEHQLCKVKVDGGGGSNLTAYWVKVSSVAALRAALDNASVAVKADLRLLPPLYVFVMPTMPLLDARCISNISAGEGAKLLPGEFLEVLPQVGKAIAICNPIDLDNKTHAYNAAMSLVREIELTRFGVETERAQLDALAETKVQVAEDTLVVYNNEKTAYEAAKAAGQLDNILLQLTRFQMMATASRLVVAREVATATVQAARSLASVSEVLAKRQADLEAAMARPTFMGCAPAAADGGNRQLSK